jgi:uncharacterized protein YceK
LSHPQCTVLVVAVCFMLSGCGTQHTATVHPQPWGTERARVMSTAIRSGQASRVANAVALPAGLTLPRSSLRLLQRIRAINFDPSSFRRTGEQTATVTVTIIAADGKAQTWNASLQMSHGVWKLAYTTLRGGR